MKKLVRNIIVSVGALASLIGIVLALHLPNTGWNGWQISLIVIAILFGLASIALDLIDFLSRPVKILKGPRKIQDYMHHWISDSSSVAIFSRDLSWVNNREMEEMLGRKARSGELTLILPNEIELSKKLAAQGATTIYYPNISYTIRSRFTIVNLGRNDVQVAIGHTTGSQHKVEEFRAGDEPAFYLAQDMLELVRRFTDQSINDRQ